MSLFSRPESQQRGAIIRIPESLGNSSKWKSVFIPGARSMAGFVIHSHKYSNGTTRESSLPFACCKQAYQLNPTPDNGEMFLSSIPHRLILLEKSDICTCPSEEYFLELSLFGYLGSKACRVPSLRQRPVPAALMASWYQVFI